MLELALRAGPDPVPVEEVAEAQGISGHYIHLLVPVLRRAGLVRTVRGPKGGCILSRPPSAITLLEVVETVEGRIAPVECMADGTLCGESGGCAAREVWHEVASAIEGVLGGMTLEQLAARQRSRTPAAATWQI